MLLKRWRRYTRIRNDRGRLWPLRGRRGRKGVIRLNVSTMRMMMGMFMMMVMLWRRRNRSGLLFIAMFAHISLAQRVGRATRRDAAATAGDGKGDSLGRRVRGMRRRAGTFRDVDGTEREGEGHGVVGSVLNVEAVDRIADMSHHGFDAG